MAEAFLLKNLKSSLAWTRVFTSTSGGSQLLRLALQMSTKNPSARGKTCRDATLAGILFVNVPVQVLHVRSATSPTGSQVANSWENREYLGGDR